MGYRMLASELYKTNWQTMIILDACRYDVFEKVYAKYFSGKLTKADTQVTSTDKWLKKYWLGEHYEKAMITANPMYEKENLKLGFGKVVNVWPGFEPIQAINKYREMKWEGPVVIHLIPPHIPFLGEKGRKIQAIFNNFYSQPALSHKAQAYGQDGHWDTIKEIYTENVEYALQVLKDNWIFTPPVVITADHGELLGECNLYGHDYDKKETIEHANASEFKRILNTVPWLEVEGVCQ